MLNLQDLVNMVIVSRHEGALEWIRRHLDVGTDYRLDVHRVYGASRYDAMAVIDNNDVVIAEIPILAKADPADIRAKVVVGNVPLCLAAEAAEVMAIEFDSPPRGAEHTADDMERAGARFNRYVVIRSKQ